MKLVALAVAGIVAASIPASAGQSTSCSVTPTGSVCVSRDDPRSWGIHPRHEIPSGFIREVRFKPNGDKVVRITRFGPDGTTVAKKVIPHVPQMGGGSGGGSGGGGSGKSDRSFGGFMGQ